MTTALLLLTFLLAKRAARHGLGRLAELVMPPRSNAATDDGRSIAPHEMARE